MCCYQEPAESGECKQAGGTEVLQVQPQDTRNAVRCGVKEGAFC